MSGSLPQPRRNPRGAVGFALSLSGCLGMGAIALGWLLDLELTRELDAWSLLYVGAFCPLGLLVSATAVYRMPKGLATAGIMLGMLGTLALAGDGAWLVADAMGLLEDPLERARRQEAETAQALQRAKDAIEEYRSEHGVLPDSNQGHALIEDFSDGWGHNLLYVPEGANFTIRSGGPDREVGNGDDRILGDRPQEGELWEQPIE